MDNHWTEDDSKDFAKFAQFFVPLREQQHKIITEIVASTLHEFSEDVVPEIAELGCGTGELAERLLEQNQGLRIIAFDGSPSMLERANRRLKIFGERIQVRRFDLSADNWRQGLKIAGCVSSLAVHHLNASEKQQLFKDIGKCMVPGAAFVLADLIRPTREVGWSIAAAAWDDAVRQQAESGNCPEAYRYFRDSNWNHFSDPNPDPVDKPSALFDQMMWLKEAGFVNVDVYWANAGHALFAGFWP